jgi:hypothetical protein
MEFKDSARTWFCGPSVTGYEMDSAGRAAPATLPRRLSGIADQGSGCSQSPSEVRRLEDAGIS